MKQQLECAKDDDGKLQLSKVPPDVIDAIAKVREYGSMKYKGADDWRAISPDRWHEALLRHVLAMWEDPWSIDMESGLPCIWHVATNAAFLCAWVARRSNSHMETERKGREGDD